MIPDYQEILACLWLSLTVYPLTVHAKNNQSHARYNSNYGSYIVVACTVRFVKTVPTSGNVNQYRWLTDLADTFDKTTDLRETWEA